MKKTHVGLVLLLALVASIFAFGSLQEDPPTQKPASLVKSGSGLLAPVNQNEAISIESLRDKVLIVNFWATWCGPCRIEIPELIALKEELNRDDFDILGVSVDDDASALMRYVKRTQFNYPVFTFSEFFKTNFGSPAYIPTTYILDKNFQVVERIQGYQTSEHIRDILKPLLK